MYGVGKNAGKCNFSNCSIGIGEWGLIECYLIVYRVRNLYRKEENDVDVDRSLTKLTLIAQYPNANCLSYKKILPHKKGGLGH